MSDIGSALLLAARLVLGFDAELVGIVARSLQVSLTAVFFASLIGLPLGAVVAVYRFPGRRGVVILLNALMGLPPVFVGLMVYLLLSRAGPLGALGLLFTPTAMVIAQTVLITPIIAALARQIVRDLFEEYREQLCSLGARPAQMVPTLLWDGRLALMTAVMAGFGRATAEVGAVFIVGGNIAHVTRVMTTAIALETSKGNLALALALGFILLAIALGVNAAVAMLGGATAHGRG
ncbi:ABC transporter permease [Minwuia thermotolerans]|uniref:ABC transporter permease n=1 Tax=Minwuia thermotolerans TaxID=2056226 RepID=A0A2M9G2B1_9PROT|nr:ABC transporter permease [Minwuia thermotolerans]PJK29859.1 ABC transporter permease [Minwuia thermotolerans]